MDWIFITTRCFAVSNAVAKTSSAVHEFVREVRESRSELDAISGDLYSLDGILDLLKDDAMSFPPYLAGQMPAILEQCATIINELGGYLDVINDPELSRPDKKFRWIATRKHIATLRMTLEAYKASLGLALDLVELSTSSNGGSTETGGTKDCPNSISDTKREVSRVLSNIRSLSMRLRGDFQKSHSISSLQMFLDALQNHADAVGLVFDADHLGTQAPSFAGDSPDSAIEMTDEPASPASRDFPPLTVESPVIESDEFLDELREMPSRPPTPPPKALARANSVRSSTMSPIDQRLRTPDGYQGPGNRRGVDDQPAVPKRMSSLRENQVSSHDLNLRPAQKLYTVVTKITAERDLTQPPKTSRLGRLFQHVRRPSIEAKKPATATSSRPSTPSDQSSLVRRNSRRLSNSFKKLPLWKTAGPVEEGGPDVEPDDVFGVSLQKSMQVAKGTAKTRHNDSSSSKREFPLCVFKCYSFLKEEGIEAPDIFGEGGDARRILTLKDAFSSPPTYGEDIDWTLFTVYDAADLILLFLSQLPKPLVPESVAKRWISLSKQATLPGSHAVRLEQCIDFWEEALTGIRSSSRSLFKLLLNLWGDIAEAADQNDMTAERLAARVLNPLMHLPPGKYNTDYMLGLAFLIRKRSEYSMILQGSTRKSKAAF